MGKLDGIMELLESKMDVELLYLRVLPITKEQYEQYILPQLENCELDDRVPTHIVRVLDEEGTGYDCCIISDSESYDTWDCAYTGNPPAYQGCELDEDDIDDEAIQWVDSLCKEGGLESVYIS